MFFHIGDSYFIMNLEATYLLTCWIVLKIIKDAFTFRFISWILFNGKYQSPNRVTLHVAYPQLSMPWLRISWWFMEPWHQQGWYWPDRPEYSICSIKRVAILKHIWATLVFNTYKLGLLLTNSAHGTFILSIYHLSRITVHVSVNRMRYNNGVSFVTALDSYSGISPHKNIWWWSIWRL